MTYRLRSENLTHLGGPMGTEYTYDNWARYYSTQAKAKAAAEKDYGKKIEWVKDEDDEDGEAIRSPDLLYVMYYINKVKVEA